jgi:hypothetical protein
MDPYPRAASLGSFLIASFISLRSALFLLWTRSQASRPQTQLSNYSPGRPHHASGAGVAALGVDDGRQCGYSRPQSLCPALSPPALAQQGSSGGQGSGGAQLGELHLWSFDTGPLTRSSVGAEDSARWSRKPEVALGTPSAYRDEDLLPHNRIRLPALQEENCRDDWDIPKPNSDRESIPNVLELMFHGVGDQQPRPYLRPGMKETQ